jgi:hypothetical protein
MLLVSIFSQIYREAYALNAEKTDDPWPSRRELKKFLKYPLLHGKNLRRTARDVDAATRIETSKTTWRSVIG